MPQMLKLMDPLVGMEAFGGGRGHGLLLVDAASAITHNLNTHKIW